MPTDHRAALANIKRFDQLIAYLRDQMGWPIARDSFEDVDDLFYDFTADELGIDPKTAAKITEIKRLRPLSPRQPWGIFFVKFEPKRLPVMALRRILSQVALKKRASANKSERTAWAADDLLFVSNYGEGDERQISFAHFSQSDSRNDLPTLKVLGWDNLDTALHLDAVARELTQHLAWPDDDADVEAWRKNWRGAFTLGHRETVTTSKDLSIRLAHLARAIRDRIKTALRIETETGPLTKLMKAFQASLVHDLDADGFADMYAQTIAYGLLSARIADPHKKTADDFAGHMRTNPFLRELMETFLKVGGRRGKAGGPGIDFDELGVSEVVELLDDANMEAVVRDFGDRNPQEDPVIHFYELFLKEYDAKKRLQRGVFYTPRPVVSFIVRFVDQLLRTDFGLLDGLADTTTWGEMTTRNKSLRIPEGLSPDHPFVQVLDPATGTGTFLVEVIDRIHEILLAKWRAQGHGDEAIEARWNEYVPRHLLPRLHGYELLMAPYAIAHLKVGLKLHETGYHFGSAERARIYLTNALEAAPDFSGTLEFAIPALAHEAQAVNAIKRSQRFTVVIGNPPYSLLSGNLSNSHRELVEPYKFVGSERIRERGALQFEKNIQDDYVKFLRIAEVAISKATLGLVGFITNHAFIDNTTFRGLRWHLAQTFDHIRILNLHGSAKRGLEGGDQNVFDIQQGVAVSLLSRTTSVDANVHEVRYSERRGSREEKYHWLAGSSLDALSWAHIDAMPPGFYFIPFGKGLPEYECAATVAEVFSQYSAGIITARDDMVIDIDRDSLLDRVTTFATSRLGDQELLAAFEVSDKKGWDVARARQSLRSLTTITPYIHEVTYRPLDKRWIFYHGSLVWGMAWPTFQHVIGRSNLVLVTTRKVEVGAFGHAMVTGGLAECHSVSMKEVNYAFPLWLYPEHGALAMAEGKASNISSKFRDALSARLELSIKDLPTEAFRYICALLHSPTYRARYAEFLRVEFPRVLLPATSALFLELARLGADLISVQLLESEKLLKFITTYAGPSNPEVGRVGWSAGTVWLDAPTKRKGHPPKPGAVAIHGVPEAVWNFHIGSYQVCEKWLKDRKGQTLSKDDIAQYQKIVVAIAETIRLMKEIDEVIEKHGGWPGAFQAAPPARTTTERVLRVAEPPAAYGSNQGEDKR